MRHGETTWNVAGRLQGVLDAPLTPRGRAQARRLARLTAHLPGRRIASPQGRAQATAQAAFPDGFETDPRLAEIGVGDFTGRLLDDLRRDRPDLCFDGLDWYDRCPQGEGFDALEARCRAFLHDLGGPALVLTHGVTLRMLRVLILGLPRAAIGRGEARQGAAHLLRAGRETLLD